MRRRALVLMMGLGCCAATTILACGDDDASSPSNPDSGTPTADSGGGGTDAGKDTSTADVQTADVVTTQDSGGGGDAAVDSGPTITSTVGPTGRITIYPDTILADYREDDTIVRASNAPECVVHISSATKPFSKAGKITVGGQVVGVDGGPASAIQVNGVQTEFGWVYEYFGPVFPADGQLTVQVEGETTAAFPAMPVQSLKSPPTAAVNITKPVAPASGDLAVPTTQGFEVTWAAPAGATADQRVLVSFQLLDNVVHSKTGTLRCSYPLAQAQAIVPANLLADLKSRFGSNVAGYLYVSVGGQSEATPSGASYVVEVTRFTTTNLSEIPVSVVIQ